MCGTILVRLPRARSKRRHADIFFFSDRIESASHDCLLHHQKKERESFYFMLFPLCFVWVAMGVGVRWVLWLLAHPGGERR